MKQCAKGSRLLAFQLCIVMLLALCVSAGAATYPYEMTCGENVNLRKSASSSAVVLKRIQAGDVVMVLGETGSYYKIQYDGVTGYAMKKYVNAISTAAEEVPGSSSVRTAPSAVDSFPYDTNTISSVKLRKTDSDKAAVLLMVPQDAVVTVLEVTTTGFAKVRYEGKTGYIMNAFLNLPMLPVASSVSAPEANVELSKYTVVQSGSEGTHVRALQEALIELGYYEGTVDSKFGAQTKTAVIDFQKKNKLEENGIANEELQQLLFEGKPINSKGTRKAVNTLPSVADITIESGNTGEPVERLQTRLKELGFYLGEVDGTCNKATVTAIKDFQTKHEMKSTGKADSVTQNTLYGAGAMSAWAVVTPTPAPTIVPPADTVREGDTGDDVKAVQQRLKDLGYYKGKVDGKFGKTSVKALKAFQEKEELNADGICGKQTREALFGTAAAAAQPTAIPLQPTAVPITEDTVVVIRSGSRGDAVRNLQQRLMDLGYYASRLDGVYLEDDISAVRAFQKANGLTVDGKAGFQTQSLLFGEGAISNNTSVTITSSLRYGSKGDEVSALQNRLIELGYLTNAADGNFGRSTKSALVDFQKANNLTTDGVAGARTQEVLASSAAVRKTVNAQEQLKEGVNGSAVRDLQNRLIALGYLQGSADGKFGAKTTLALIAFQKRNSLAADGVAGSKTLTMLNSTKAKQAAGAAAQATPKPDAITLPNAPQASSVRYANWYSEIKARCKLYPNVTIYDFSTGLSWQVNLFSLGAHADGEPISANDTANMNRAFGGKTTWTPKPVWVVFSDGRVYLASTHNTPHDTSHNRNNDFSGHLCVHFPRTDEQVAAIGKYATSHQKAIDLAWQTTLRMAGK